MDRRIRACSGVLFAVAMLVAPVRVARAQQVAAQRLLGQAGVPVTATHDATTGAVIVLRGASVPLAGGRERATLALRDWVFEHGAAFGLDAATDDIMCERDEPLPDGRHRIQLRQYWNRIPVEGADARGIVDAQGELRYLACGFLSTIRCATSAVIGSEQALRSAVRATGGVPPAQGPGLWVRRRDGVDRLAWRVVLLHEGGRETLSWVDALEGTLLAADDAAVHALGFVYPTDPRAPLAQVDLPRLVPAIGLQSPWLGIDDTLYPEAEPVGPGGDYRFSPSQPSFDQVNVYWHADRFLHDFLGSLGYAGPPESLIVRINRATEPFVAQTSGRYVDLGRPIPGFVQDVARSQDIIYHELTHGVLYGYGVLASGPRREAVALHEGLADYFAAAFTGDPGIGQWLYLTFPDGATRVDQPVEPWNYAHYDQVGYAGGEIGSPWGNGMILSSTLWELRGALGVSADSLVLEALVYLPEAPVWSQFANALLQADADHHAGRWQGEVVRVLTHRRIRGAVESGISGPQLLAAGVRGTYHALPCCGGSALGAYHWRVREWCRGRPCSDWHDLADGPDLETAFQQDSELQLTVLTPWADTLVSAPFFVGVSAPELHLAGPHRLAQHGIGRWSARYVAMGPVTVQWHRTWRRPFALPVAIARALEVSFAADSSCDLRVTLTDGLGRQVVRQWAVETFADRALPDRTARLLVVQHWDAVMQRAELSLELVQASSVRATVYDVRGRARVQVWNGPLAVGTHVVRWDVGALEPGVYWLRVLAEPSGALQRFVVVR